MFRYDLWWPTNQSAPKNPHTYGIQVLAPWAALRRDGQHQAGAFFASDGAELITPPELRVYWKRLPPARRQTRSATYSEGKRHRQIYAALWNSSIWRIQLVSGFHLGQIWATKFPNPRKRMQARRLSGSIA